VGQLAGDGVLLNFTGTGGNVLLCIELRHDISVDGKYSVPDFASRYALESARKRHACCLHVSSVSGGSTDFVTFHPVGLATTVGPDLENNTAMCANITSKFTQGTYFPIYRFAVRRHHCWHSVGPVRDEKSNVSARRRAELATHQVRRHAVDAAARRVLRRRINLRRALGLLHLPPRQSLSLYETSLRTLRRSLLHSHSQATVRSRADVRVSSRRRRPHRCCCRKCFSACCRCSSSVREP
jgi:hypothetical protein